MTEADRTKCLEKLSEVYAADVCALEFQNPFQLLIATMLSAQCTDKQVNKTTKVLFPLFPDPEAFAVLTPEQLEPHIHSCGVYRTKARNIVATCRKLVEEYGSVVPNDFDALTSLPGVGRKTANVVLSNAFGVDAIAVDTHVFRVSNRLGLAHATTVEKTEEDLRRNIPREQWSHAHHWLIWHGRRICGARKPACQECPVSQWCDYYQRIAGE